MIPTVLRGMYYIIARQAIRSNNTKKLGLKLLKDLNINPAKDKIRSYASPSIIRNMNTTTDTAFKILKKEPNLRFLPEALRIPGKSDKMTLIKNMRSGSLEQFKPITKNVGFRKGFLYSPSYDKASNAYFLSLKRTPMIDIDLPNALRHSKAQITFDSQKEAIKNLIDYARLDKKSLFRVYKTPAGLRIFNTGKRTRPSKSTHTIDKALGGDYSYRRGVMERGTFDARLSPKPGFTNDFGARYLGTIGQGSANPQNLMEITKYHDGLIRHLIRETNKFGHPTSNGLFSLMKFINGG